MPHVEFTSHLQRHVACPACDVPGETVREALENVFAQNRDLEGYIVDDLKRLRKHVVIFIDGQMIRDRETLSDVVSETSEIYVMQALSGG
ncbi:MAG: hypothetical protein Tsb009_29950 [Planctomycetaceae bacterium]